MSLPFGHLSLADETGDMPGESQSYTRTMSITHADFLRSLIPLRRYYRYDIDQDTSRILINDAQRSIQIKLGAQGHVDLGSLRMPSTEVTFKFQGFSSTERDLFWSRFDLCFRRGGG